VHHIWNVDKVKALVADQSNAVAFFCGGSRNFIRFMDLFDQVFVLEIDMDTLTRRLVQRPKPSGAEGLRSGNSSRDCTQRKKTSRKMVS